MKKLLVVSILMFSVIMGAIAQDKAEDLKKLFSLMQSEKMIDGMMSNMVPALTQQARAQMNDESEKEKFDEFMNFVIEEAKTLSKTLIDVEMVQIYDKHFSHEEIKDMIDFYESPTGKKMIEKTPELTTEMMTSMMNKHMPEFQQRVEKKLESMK
ncbi:DUF2059 domain-containing protein [Roseimarinus sediminis]|jgi:hypothetical protein|uniref:DUF2059 domain-containing protein n=1 Tax=Roseimarinus sediminis TaxID=1610899 RepID=UPI003D24B67E